MQADEKPGENKFEELLGAVMSCIDGYYLSDGGSDALAKPLLDYVAALEKERDFWNEQHADMCLRYHAKVAKLEQERDKLNKTVSLLIKQITSL